MGLRSFQRLAERHRTSPTREHQSEDTASEETRIGLTELYSPENPRIDFVFVHGLQGGSFKTWRKHEDPAYLWPKSWLPLHSELSDVRTSTFGYQSDWLSRRDSTLNVQDFGRKLFGELQTSSFLRKSRDTPIVLIGHSMGGLVIKQAYLLARRELSDLAARIKSMVFLATPHSGADSAKLLYHILQATGNEKKYVNDLLRSSPSLQLINDEFRHFADDVGLWSFFEERKTQAGVKPKVVVDRDSATLGSRGERIVSLDADHHEICKFESPEDRNYLKLRSILATIVDQLIGHGTKAYADEKSDQVKSISSLLNVFDSPKEDLEEQDALKTPGTCQWVLKKPGFLEWVQIPESQGPLGRNGSTKTITSLGFKSNCGIFWLTAPLGTGKSVCSAHVVTSLQEQGQDCCYFFFHHSGKNNTLLSSMLRSIAFQMAELHPEIRRPLYQISLAAVSIDKDDEVAVWKHIFTSCVLKTQLKGPQFWILDALDECSAAEKIFPLLARLEPNFPLRVFITSRPKPEFERGFHRLSHMFSVTMDSIQPEDTHEDMKLYLSSNGPWLDIGEEDGQISGRLLAKSNGCFLWTKLVHQELEGVYLQDTVESVLDEIPSGMTALYERSLAQMSKHVREKRLTRALLTFSVCAVRPLKLSELQVALRTDANLQILDLRLSIEGLCGSLLYVDRNDCVQLVHPTVRDFLSSKDVTVSEYAVQRDTGHERLAKTCLKYMEAEMRLPRSRSFGRSLETSAVESPVFAQYAATAFSEHVAASSSTSDSLLIAISGFLGSSVLAWIEHVASKEPSLYCLTRTAKNFIRYLERRAKYVAPFGTEFKLVQDWARDLIRLVAKFGRKLREQPSSIYFLIPSIAPKQSRFYEYTLKNPTWLKMYGDATSEWDDCLSFIEYRETYATALACGQKSFAIGMKNGRITIYDHSTCQEQITVTHRSQEESRARQASTVKLLAFDLSDERFASCGLQSICVWSLDGDMLHIFESNEPHVAMAFSSNSDSIIAVTRSSRVTRLRLTSIEDELAVPREYSRRRSSGYYRAEGLQLPRQAPLAAAISPNQTTLALLYRGKPIYLYNLEDDTLLGTCGRDANSSTPNISVLTALFHPNPDVSLLAVSHQDGDLALFDPWTQKELKSVHGDAYSLATSPTGHFLGTGNTGGTLRLWAFETLELLYVIRSGLGEIRGLTFTGDGMRIVDRRDSRVKIWEPSALVRQSTAEDESISLSDATTLPAPEVGENEEEVTTTVLTTDAHGLSIFAGSSDGSIAVYEAKSGCLATMIHPDTGDDFVVAVACEEGMLACANSSQAVTVFKLSDDTGAMRRGDTLFQKTVAEPVQQLAVCPSNQRVLIVTSGQDSLWDFATGQAVKVLSYGAGKIVSSRRWTSIGSNIVALTLGEEVRLYNWSTLEEHQCVTLSIPAIQESLTASPSEVEGVTFSTSGQHLIAALKPQTPNQSRTHLVVWNNPFHLDVPELSTKPLMADLILGPKHVRHFLGVHRDQIVFLDHDLWICSLDLKEFGQTGMLSIRKHIFIPPDLVGSPNEAKPIITPQGLLVFSKVGSLAIIQGALDWNFS